MSIAEPLPSTTESGRERIMDEAALLFLRLGYEGTSLRQLADVVGMKAGSLYYHFSSKDDLLTEVLRRGIDVMHAAFDVAEAAVDPHDPRERLTLHVRAHLSALHENGPYTAAHVTTFRTSPEAVRSVVVPLRDSYEARWATLLTSMQCSGLITDTADTSIARLALFGAMNSSIEWFDPDRGDLDRFADAITSQFWNGVAA